MKGIFFPNWLITEPTLNWTERVLLLEIKNKSVNGVFSLKNSELCEVTGVCINRIAQCLNKLEQYGYIKRKTLHAWHREIRIEEKWLKLLPSEPITEIKNTQINL